MNRRVELLAALDDLELAADTLAGAYPLGRHEVVVTLAALELVRRRLGRLVDVEIHAGGAPDVPAPPTNSLRSKMRPGATR